LAYLCSSGNIGSSLKLEFLSEVRFDTARKGFPHQANPLFFRIAFLKVQCTLEVRNLWRLIPLLFAVICPLFAFAGYFFFSRLFFILQAQGCPRLILTCDDDDGSFLDVLLVEATFGAQLFIQER
jgi:hypothetical protein